MAATTKKYPYLLILIGVSFVAAMPRADSSAKAGQLKLTPSITVSERYDDNIFFEETDIDTDFITAIAPQLTASYRTQAVEMASELGAGVELFAQHTELNKLQYRANVRLNIAQFMKNTSLSVSDVFRFSPEPPAFLVADEEEVTTGGIRVPRGDSLSNSVRIGLIRKISPRSDGNIRYTHTTRAFEEPLLVDSTEHSIQVGLSRQVKLRDRLNTGYQYQLFLPDKTEKSESHTGSIGWDHQFTQTFSANMGAGSSYVITDLDDALVFSGSFNVSRRFELTRLNLGYSRSISTTSGLSSEPITSQVVSATINSSLTRQLTVNLSQNYATNRSTITDDVDLTSWQTRIRLTMWLRPWLSAEAEYSYFSQHSGGPGSGREFNRNQALVSLNAHLP